MNSYKKNYIQIYLWQSLSFILNFVALFIVTPLISDKAEIFGIYSVCVGLNIFLQYTDFGFINAGSKYAAEAYIAGNHDKEDRYLSTSFFIFSVVSISLIAFLFVASFNPKLVISDLKINSDNYFISQKLLFITAVSIPAYILQKYVLTIYAIRLRDYEVQRINIIGSILRIASVPLVFFNNRYDIIGYYVFSQVIVLVATLYALWRSKVYGYGLRSILNVIKYDRDIFLEIKPLALSGFVASLAWLAYYEIDNLIISIWIGSKAVAIYAIGKNIQSVVRSLFGIIYSPYSVRFNYYVGSKDVSGLKEFFMKLVRLFSNITVVPLIVLIFFAKPFVLAWVGAEYMDSCLILQLLVGCFLFNYVVSPAGSLLYSMNRVKDVVISNIAPVVVFYVGLVMVINTQDVTNMAVLKLLASIASLLFCIWVSSNIIYGRLCIRKILCTDRLLFPCLLSGLLSYFVSNMLDINDKSKLSLLFVIGCMATVIAITFLLIIIFDKKSREDLRALIKR